MDKYPNVDIETGCGTNEHWKIIEAILLQTVKNDARREVVTPPRNTTGLLLGGLVPSTLLLCEKLTQASGKMDIQGEE